ncbi:molybdenum cofactor guanylyltransferase MobA [Paracidovorax cattleyae]|uniref:molybdenum cofactor guanylyltransferase MobA n=1 Tax=Paracidovorax cattleyae TaxID=80868 RepID=UPI001FC98F1A|nr:molybdenum cofactor guanylyltransferase MobA [Paracidovorax cattleyae]
MIGRADIAGMVLAGGQGSRMGGLDKGLQPFRGRPLAAVALERLRSQAAPGRLSVSANRHLDRYAALGVPVLGDALPGHPGPLAGLLAGLQWCGTPWLLAVPCDTPCFPLDLGARLAEAAMAAGADIAIAAAPESLPPGPSGAGPAPLRLHPVVCLLRADLQGDLRDYLNGGGRKVLDWMGRHALATATFDRPGNDPNAFRNANTLAELHRLEADTA